MSIFSNIQMRRHKKNVFNLSHEKKMTIRFADLVPTLVQEILPGDEFRVSTETFIRCAPMLAPIMHRVNVFTHYFFVPNRLVWSEWEDFITGGPDGTAEPVHPYFTLNTAKAAQYTQMSLPDYLGMPIGFATPVDNPVNWSALPARAYQLIWNEYFRDQNLQTPFPISKASGQDTSDAEVTLQQRCWEKDYFTSALPFAQRGPDAVVPVEGTVGPGSFRTSADWDTNPGGGNAVTGAPQITTGGVMRSNNDLGNSIYANIVGEGDITGGEVNVNDLRRSIRLQEWLEKNARGGARYIEQILSHFGVRSSDARLQRPEYLGGAYQPLRVSEVLSTYQAEDSTTPNALPQGNMAGHGIMIGNANFKKRFEEHGHVIGIMSVIPKTSYQQGIPRSLSRFDKFDYAWPEFAQIGEQAVLSKELYYQSTGSDPNDGTFGYQSRYAEYKYGISTVHGRMRDQLDFWHLGRKFSAFPNLNEDFVKANPSDRIFAVTDGEAEQFYCQVYNNVKAKRILPYYGTPTI